MAKGFIIENVRVTGGFMRLRDARTGNVVDVPLTVGGALTLPGGEAEAGAEETATDDDDDAVGADEDESDDAVETAKRKRRRRRARARRAEAEREKVEEAPALDVPRSRPVTEDPTPIVDESTLSDEDRAAVEQFRALASKASAQGKRGGLGWQEITVEGRSVMPLFEPVGSGAFVPDYRRGA